MARIQGKEPSAEDVAEALERKLELADPIQLTITEDTKGFEKIVGMKFVDEPEPKPDPSLERHREFLSACTSPEEPIGSFDFSNWRRG